MLTNLVEKLPFCSNVTDVEGFAAVLWAALNVLLVFLCPKLCGRHSEVWRMELHHGHEGLHRPGPHTRSGLNHCRGSQPEDLGGADDHRTGCKRDRRGNGFMLGNQPRFSQQPAKI